MNYCQARYDRIIVNGVFSGIQRQARVRFCCSFFTCAWRSLREFLKHTDEAPLKLLSRCYLKEL